jgi:hypothetical protein
MIILGSFPPGGILIADTDLRRQIRMTVRVNVFFNGIGVYAVAANKIHRLYDCCELN